MDKKKTEIKSDDIETKDLPRRKFFLSAAGTVVASGIAMTGCGGGGGSDPGCDVGANFDGVYRDNDPSDLVVVGGDTCDSD